MLSKKKLIFVFVHFPPKNKFASQKINYIRVLCDNLNFIVIFSYNDGDDAINKDIFLVRDWRNT